MAHERANDPVFASVTAVGLLGVAQLTQSQTPLDMARKSYGHALRLTNAALRDPDQALKDTTMLSVLVLGLFETGIDRSTRGVKAWQQHINGAAALARMRGLGQFRTQAGIRSELRPRAPSPPSLLLQRQCDPLLGLEACNSLAEMVPEALDFHRLRRILKLTTNKCS